MKNGFKIFSTTLASAVLLISDFALAEAPAKPNLPCEAERAQFCADTSSPGEAMVCLFKNASSLSNDCRQDLQRMIAEKRAASERGGGALTAFGGANSFGPPLPLVTYQGAVIPSESGGPTQSSHRLDLSAPVAKFGGETLGASLTASQIDFGRRLALDSGQSVASDLDRFELGVQYFHQSADLSSWSVRGSAGYAGDAAGDFPRDASYSFAGTYGFAGSGSDYWVLLIFVANNSVLANYVPIPGVIYIHKTEHFTGVFGFPVLSMQWTPSNNWVYSAMIFGPTATAEAAYGALGSSQWFVNYAYTLQSFIPAVRLNEKDRVIVHEEKIGPGYRIPIADRVLIEAQVGYSFERFVAIETGLLKRDGGSTSLPSGTFGALTLKATF